ncbi:MAG TPA: N-acetylmuramoyl-L-alanine amidase [Thermoanaerobaculaceae bacterium]|nr:N-acetylmuramoyl-L-alanine amidase [Thermoanaerobaculaceae bacterium]
MALDLASPARRRRRLKQRMLRDAVDENLAVMEGVPRARRALRRRRWLGWTGAAAAAVLLAGAIGTFSAAHGRSASPAADVVAPSEPTSAPAASAPAFAAPQAIDPALFRLRVRKVVIDPGHGGSDPGAMTGGVAEKEITLDVARRLASDLSSAGFVATLTRDDDRTLSLQERVAAANAAGGDVFLSIHVNSIPVAVRRGVETYYLGPASDPGTEKLAGAENSGSGYSLADFRRLLAGVYADVRQDESRRFAQAVQGRLFAALRRTNPELEDRGVKKAPFVVLVGTEMPSVLTEVSCISNPEELRLLGEERYRDDIARALAAGVRAYAAARSGDAAARSRAAAR